MMKTFVPAFTALLIAAAVTGTSPAEAAGRRICRGPWVANTPTVYDDVKQGIAFEFEKEPIPESPCIAIMVHLPGQSQVATQEEVEALLEKGAKR
jgi:hypothetical protein